MGLLTVRQHILLQQQRCRDDDQKVVEIPGRHIRQLQLDHVLLGLAEPPGEHLVEVGQMGGEQLKTMI